MGFPFPPRSGLLVLATGILLAGCGSPFQALTPTEALAAYDQKVALLQSVRYDLNGSMTMQLSPSLAAALSHGNASASSSLSTISFTLSGNGAIQYPNRMSMHMKLTFKGETVTVDEVLAGGTLYVKNPLTGAWMTSAEMKQFGSQAGQLDPLSATRLPDARQSVRDLGETTLNGVTVLHYQIIPDKGRLGEQLSSSPAVKDPRAQALLRDVLSKGTFHIETWIGKSDYLPRRISIDEDFTMDLARATSLMGGSVSAGSLPSGDVHLTMHFVMDFHDFNSSVNITAPTPG